MSNDPAKPRVVLARLPQKAFAHANFTIDPLTMRKIVKDGRLSPLGEFAGLIFHAGLLESPVAVFQGLKRPYISDGLDNFIYIYIMNPAVTFWYAPRDRFEGTGPWETAAPKDSVFTVFVSMAQDVIKAATSDGRAQDDSIRGVILAWEWTKSSPNNRRLPEFHDTRYRRMICPPAG